ncbi:hypothetical protein B0H15DRAFT_947421 [Mycena belliarum]|uniref:Uncharacterized protein n=1 Tax=Mycena belliarum TaxID=1033014 RepID=A0AAD6XUA1_9AGAR|nr:hypothetical protein B0H15DRAFT_947421 [Mycena belliae]
MSSPPSDSLLAPSLLVASATTRLHHHVYAESHARRETSAGVDKSRPRVAGLARLRTRNDAMHIPAPARCDLARPSTVGVRAFPPAFDSATHAVRPGALRPCSRRCMLAFTPYPYTYLSSESEAQSEDGVVAGEGEVEADADVPCEEAAVVGAARCALERCRGAGEGRGGATWGCTPLSRRRPSPRAARSSGQHRCAVNAEPDTGAPPPPTTHNTVPRAGRRHTTSAGAELCALRTASVPPAHPCVQFVANAAHAGHCQALPPRAACAQHPVDSWVPLRTRHAGRARNNEKTPKTSWGS